MKYKKYREVEAEAWSVYLESIAPAKKVYDEAKASAWNLYTDTIDQTWEAFKEEVSVKKE